MEVLYWVCNRVCEHWDYILMYKKFPNMLIQHSLKICLVVQNSVKKYCKLIGCFWKMMRKQLWTLTCPIGIKIHIHVAGSLNQNIALHIWSCLHTTHISSVPALHITYVPALQGTYFGKPGKLLCQVLKFYKLKQGACFCAGFTSWESATQISKYTYTILCIKTNTNGTNNNKKYADKFMFW